MSKYLKSLTIALAASCLSAPAMAEKLGLGRAALPAEIAAWDWDINAMGDGLPVGSGDVLDGEEIFAEKCAACHGDFAEGVDNWPKLAGGADTLDHEDPLKTVGSYWPHLTTAYDYIKRSMPYGNAGTLSDDEVYAIVAYILYSNDLIEEDFVLSNENFMEFEMPNAGGFIVDNRAETEYAIWSGEPCMTACKDSVAITMRALVLDVTPELDGNTATTAVSATAAPEPAPEPRHQRLIWSWRLPVRKCSRSANLAIRSVRKPRTALAPFSMGLWAPPRDLWTDLNILRRCALRLRMG